MNASQQNSIDLHNKIKDLYQLIGEGHNRIGDQREERAILILGETGAGKSTLTYLFAEKDLEARLNEEGVFIIEAKEQLEGVVISSKKVSETKIPTKVKSQSGLVLWDCPGFSDIGREPTQDIANAFYVQRLFDTNKQLKLVLVIPEHHTKGKGSDIIRIVGHFVQIFNSIEEIQNSVSLVITQSSPGRTKEHFAKILENILSQNKSLKPLIRLMLTYLQKSIMVFPTPIVEGPINKKLYQSITSLMDESSTDIEYKYENSILHSSESNTQYFETSPGSVNVVISPNSTELANELFQITQITLSELFTQLAKNISQICARVCNKGNEISTISNQWNTQKSFPYDLSIKKHKELLNIENIMYIDNFYENMLRLNQNPQEQLKMFVSKINTVVSILLQYLPIIDEDIQQVAIKFNQQCKYFEFLSCVCKNNIMKRDLFSNVLQQHKLSLSQATLKGLEIINFNPNEETIDYYTKLIDLFDYYPTNDKCKIQKSKAYFCIAQIRQQQRKNDLAIEASLKSVKFNQNYHEPKNLINWICKYDNSQLVLLNQEFQILKFLFDLNNEAQIQLIEQQINSILYNYSMEQPQNQSSQLMNQVENLYKILEQICQIFNKKVSKDIQQFIQNITNILTYCGQQDNVEQLLNTFKLNSAYIDCINQTAEYKYSNEIDYWAYNLNAKIIQQSMIEKIKQLDVANGSLEYYQKIILYANFQMKIKSGDLNNQSNLKKSNQQYNLVTVQLNLDPICVQKRAQSYLEIGKIQQNMKIYDEALQNYIRSILLQDKDDSYRKIDELYFLTKNIQINNEQIQDKLFQLNSNQCIQMFKDHLLIFIDAYGDLKYFNQQTGEQQHELYLKNLSELNDICNVFAQIKQISITQQYSEFINNIRQLGQILSRGADENYIRNIIQKEYACELVEKSSDLFRLDAICKQTEYVLLQYNNINRQEAKSQALNQINSWIQLFDHNKLQAKYLINVQNIKLPEKENRQYFEKVISLVAQYQQDKFCLKLNAQAHLYIANILNDQNELQESTNYYKYTIFLNDVLYQICTQNRDNSFYSQSSCKRDACEKLGDIFYNLKNYQEALVQYIAIKNSIKAKQCFKKIIEVHPNQYFYREEQGDYYSSIGQYNSAIKSYNDACSLTADPDVHARICKKISDTLSSVGPNTSKAKEFLQRSIQIATTKIVF